MPQPTYEFLGYNVTEIKYINEHKDNTFIKISIPKDYYIEKLKQYRLFIKLSTDFSNEESYFVFLASFFINDEKWFKTLNDSEKKSLFFSIVFPFIREKVLSITADSNPGLLIPTIDLQNLDFNKEIRLIRGTTPDE